MSNGVRRAAASGLKASAGSNVSKRYKKLSKKLGVKHKTPGALIGAAQALGKAAKGAKFSSRSFRGIKKAPPTRTSPLQRQNLLNEARKMQGRSPSNSPERLREIQRGVASTRASTVDSWNRSQGVQKRKSVKRKSAGSVGKQLGIAAGRTLQRRSIKKLPVQGIKKAFNNFRFNQTKKVPGNQVNRPGNVRAFKKLQK